MDEKLMAELETLKKGLEGKTASQVKSAIDAFEVSAKENVAGEVKQVREAVELELKGIKNSLEGYAGVDAVKAMQDHLDKLDLKLQSKTSDRKDNASFGDAVKSSIKDNFTSISKVSKGSSAKMELKAVGNMTLGNLTGDQPRDYSNTVIAIPSPLVNFVDLIGAPINISGGTYTFPQETTSEGAIALQTEGASKGQIDYDFTMVDVNTDFLAGYTRYSKKMANNLSFLESFLPSALRRDYMKAENARFNTALSASALASTEIITGKNKVEMLMNEVSRLEQLDNPVNGIVVSPADWWDIQKTEKSTGAGYGLPGVITFSNGVLYVNGIPVYKATWLTANKYYVGDWSRIKKVVTEGLSLEFSNEDADNFTKNNITARIEAQTALAIERANAVILGDFTAV